MEKLGVTNLRAGDLLGSDYRAAIAEVKRFSDQLLESKRPDVQSKGDHLARVIRDIESKTRQAARERIRSENHDA